MPLRIQVTLPYVTGIPEDVAVNTFHSAASPGDIVSGAAVLTAIEGFYDDLAGFLSGLLAGTIEVKTYDMSQPEPRVPISEEVISPGFTPEGTTLPEEVAMCISWRAERPSGVPAARARGRTYIGPLDASVVAADSLYGRSVIAPAVINTMVTAATEFLQAMKDNGVPLAIYSRADNAYRTINGGWVDNAFDTQRRRGPDPFQRSTFTHSTA